MGSDAASSTPPPGSSATKKILSQHKVRTSAADRTLDSMFLPPGSLPGELDNAAARNGADVVKERRKTREIPQSICYLTSVLTLRENIKKVKHAGAQDILLILCDVMTNGYDLELTEILQKHVFVGVVDLDRELSVMQYLKKLYLVNHGTLAYVLHLQRCDEARPTLFSQGGAVLSTRAQTVRQFSET
jgi:DNA mismatch repair protein MLH1